ncbi:hypothetical protein [Streptosporangium sp. NPDC001681]|uniref:hypothetical protein n=1 Tax=Streptosporangium sp. NPDC001681 TaxID=3154395 RepID=UPI0033249BEF
MGICSIDSSRAGASGPLHLRQERTRPLYADPFSGNIGSVRVLEKCGFLHVETVQYGEHERTGRAFLLHPI